MPYTPPAPSFPSVSHPTSPSPAPTLTHSYPSAPHRLHTRANGSVNPLPRSLSSSYLTMHRRGPSASKPPPTHLTATCPPSTKDVIPELNLDRHAFVLQSPPPDNISSDSSDDGDAATGDRGRELKNLAELQAAISTIEQNKESSPERAEEVQSAAPHLEPSRRPAVEFRFPSASDSDSPPSRQTPLSASARRISHSRSSTDGTLTLDTAPTIPTEQNSDDDENDDLSETSRPPMVRKKSGELVRPALRPTSCTRRPSSMPGTPTYSKAVHFDAHLEHVRHFLQVDKPLAVSAGSSPVEAYHAELEFPFGKGESGQARASAYEWEIALPNSPSETVNRQHLPVRTERVFLSSNNNNLVGCVAVHNIAYQKRVTVRFTFDHWNTTSEVTAEYNDGVRGSRHPDGRDRFNFFIRLADQANLDQKTMFFCVRYEVDGRQFWDNNESRNYQVEFFKKPKRSARNNLPSLGTRPLTALPRSRFAPPMSAGMASPPPASHSFDEFASSFDSFRSIKLDDSVIKTKTSRPRPELLPDAPIQKPKANNAVFGHRYDFGASLSAAIQNASAFLGDENAVARNDGAEQLRPVTAAPSGSPAIRTIPPQRAAAAADGPHGAKGLDGHQVPRLRGPAPLLAEKPTLRSESYQELVDKYCFYGSSKSAPTGTSVAQLDGAQEPTGPAAGGDGTGSESSSSSPSMESPMEADQTVHRSSPAVPSSPTTAPHFGSATSPSSGFRYPFHSSLGHGIFDAQTATAIQG